MTDNAIAFTARVERAYIVDENTRPNAGLQSAGFYDLDTQRDAAYD